MDQKIRFTRSRDGTRIAYAESDAGLPLVKTGNWLSHLRIRPPQTMPTRDDGTLFTRVVVPAADTNNDEETKHATHDDPVECGAGDGSGP
jgi:hypothetical protein